MIIGVDFLDLMIICIHTRILGYSKLHFIALCACFFERRAHVVRACTSVDFDIDIRWVGNRTQRTHADSAYAMQARSVAP